MRISVRNPCPRIVCFPPDRGRPTTGATTPPARSSYYNADTADLEIGQEFEDAEAEEEAALELQRASYKRLDPADYGEEEEEEGDEASETAKEEGGGKGKGKTAAKRRERDGTSSAAGAQGEALRAMKSDLEQIALGAGGEVCLLPVCGFALRFRLVVLGCWKLSFTQYHSHPPRFHRRCLYPPSLLVSTVIACINYSQDQSRESLYQWFFTILPSELSWFLAQPQIPHAQSLRASPFCVRNTAACTDHEHPPPPCGILPLPRDPNHPHC